MNENLPISSALIILRGVSHVGLPDSGTDDARTERAPYAHSLERVVEVLG
jgi:hypothetical protein